MKVPTDSQSLWLAGARRRAGFPALSEDVEVDVAIIGAGITGLTAALKLAKAGRTVAVLEGREIATGVTGHSSAHLTELLDTRYKTLVDDFGLEKARLVAGSSRLAIDEVVRHIREERISCGFRRVPGYLYTETGDASALEAETTAARAVGIDASMTRSVPLPFARAAMTVPNQAEFQPAEYVEGLAAALSRLGARIFERTHVSDVSEGAPHVLATARGKVKAKTVVYATHTPLSRFVLQPKLARYQSYVVAFAPQTPIARALYWDTADPYHYTRTLDVGSARLLVVGGEDHKTGQKDGTEAFARLEAYAAERYGASSIHYRWSAQVLESVDGLPFIGREPMSAEAYVATGFSGNGLTLGTLAGMMISDAILGLANPYAELYAPSRFTPLASAKDFIVENLDVPIHLIAGALRLARARPPSSVDAGAADIVVQDGKLVALYRDAHGCAHSVGAICPHMGCVVEWNASEKTWDCPCHGSRFDLAGKVLTGPARTGLPQVEGIDEGPAGPGAITVRVT